MWTLGIPLSLAVVLLQIISVHATPCDQLGVDEFTTRSAKLPSLIVVPPGGTFDSAIAQALNCALPPAPTFAGGERVDLKEVVGQQVFTGDGMLVGSVSGLAVAPDTAKTKSLVRMDFGDGTANAAIPFEALKIGKKAGFVVENFGKRDVEKKWPVGSNKERIGKDEVVVVSACVMCGFHDLIPIDMTSDPPGGTAFVGDEKWGSTEIQGDVNVSKIEKIRIEYPKRKSCLFADGKYTPAEETGLGYATFFCKLQAEQQ
jgi:sporulation protein YlmC with PRC-barrel domain